MTKILTERHRDGGKVRQLPPVRVLHVIPFIAPRYGGPTQAVLGICEALLAHTNIAVEIATTDADGPAGRLVLAGSNPRVLKGVPVWLFRRTFSESWKYARELGGWLRRHAGDYDLIHVHGVFSYATTAACSSAARAGIPVIIRACGMLSPWSLRQSRVRKFLYWNLLEKHNLRSARWLHATTLAEQDELQALLPGQRVFTIPLGLDGEAWSVPKLPGRFRERYGIPQDRPLLLFLARLHRKKGLSDLLLPALVRLPEDVMLAVVGGADPIDSNHDKLVREMTCTLGLSSRVVFTGPLYSREKWSAYDDADIYVLPSFHENFGITAVEAMARGVPSVLSSEVQASRYVVESGSGQVVPPNIDALVDAISHLLEKSRETRTAMGQRGKELARKQLSWNSTVNKLANSYRDILSDR